MSTCGTHCSNISPVPFWKTCFSEPQWKCSLPAVDFTGWLNAAAFWECPWSWKSFWEIPTNQQGQFPDLFICFLLRLSYNAPTAKRWIYNPPTPQKTVSSFLKLRSSFPSCFQLNKDSVGNGLGLGLVNGVNMQCQLISTGATYSIPYFYIFMNEFQRCSCA